MTRQETEFDFAAMQAEGNQAGIPELYVLTMTPLIADEAVVTPPGGATALEAHYAYVHRLVERGAILLIGPCMGEPVIAGQSPVPPGIGILRAASRSEAEEIAYNEPFHVMGWRRNSVMSWTPKFGYLIGALGDAIRAES